ncbi:hypothetical protein JCM24511_04916 [Saitozyma sp. JCM 24511]|nr:hypothetical protein JCM24511_04916 [Saitozyma sp. JCM 24511]
MTYAYPPQNLDDLEPQDWPGYEGDWPNPQWPGGAKVCVSFVVHAEAGAESHETNGDAYPEAWLNETVFGRYGTLPHNAGTNSSSVYEYETCRGFWNVLDVFDRYSLPATLFVCGRSAEVFPTYITEAESRGWELVSENYRFLDYYSLDPSVELEHATKAIESISKASTKGTVPRSYYMSRPSPISESVAVEAWKNKGVELGYSNCAYGDDLPYYGLKNGILYVPMSLDCNDQKFISAPGFSSGVDFYDHISSAFDCLYKEGLEGSQKMMTGRRESLLTLRQVALHPRIISRPGRLAYLINLIEHIQKHEGVWIPTRSEIAEYVGSGLNSNSISVSASACVIRFVRRAQREGTLNDDRHWKKVHPRK